MWVHCVIAMQLAKYVSASTPRGENLLFPKTEKKHCHLIIAFYRTRLKCGINMIILNRKIDGSTGLA